MNITMQQEEVGDYFKTKRNQYVVEIRKQKNHNLIKLKRNKLCESHLDDKENISSNAQVYNTKASSLFKQIKCSFLQCLEDEDYQELTKQVQMIRTKLSITENPPIQDLRDSEIIPLILDFLDSKYFHLSDLVKECSWVIVNIASGESKHIEYLISLDVIPKAVELFDHPNIDIQENAIWIAANIAGDSTKYRELLFRDGLTDKLEGYFYRRNLETSFLTQLTWLISNLCRGKPYPKFNDIKPLVRLIKNFLESKDKMILVHTLWMIIYISDEDPDQTQEILDLDITERLLELLNSKDSTTIQSLALKAVCNILTGEDAQAQHLIEHQVIGYIAPFLDHPKKLIRKDACWAISNILACGYKQIGEILSYNGGEIIQKFFNMINQDLPEIARECIIGLSQISCGAMPNQIHDLVEVGLIEIISGCLRKYAKDNEIIKACIETLENVLEVGAENFKIDDNHENPYILKAVQSGTLPLIEKLQTHPDNDIYTISLRIIEKNFEYE